MYWQRANGLALTSSLRAFVVKSHASRFDSKAAKLKNHHLCRALGNWFCIDSGRCRRSVKPSENGR